MSRYFCSKTQDFRLRAKGGFVHELHAEQHRIVLRGVCKLDLSFSCPQWSAHVTSQLDRAASWNSRQDGFDSSLFYIHQSELILDASIDEAILSCQIEGISINFESARSMLREGRSPVGPSEWLVVNLFHLIRNLHELRDEPLSSNFLNRIYQKITQNTYEKPPVQIQAAEIEGLLQFMDEESDDFFVHPLLKSEIIQGWILKNQPWSQFNGIMSRLLFRWFLLRKRYDIINALSPSWVMNRSLLDCRRAQNVMLAPAAFMELTGFLQYMTRVTDISIRRLRLNLKSMHNTLNQAGAEAHRINHRQRAALVKTGQIKDYTYTTGSYGRDFKVSTDTARSDLLRLVDLGLFIKLPTIAGNSTLFKAAPRDQKKR